MAIFIYENDRSNLGFEYYNYILLKPVLNSYIIRNSLLKFNCSLYIFGQSEFKQTGCLYSVLSDP